jgi:hypothetical protein
MTMTAVFDDPYGADRAVARLRELGIRVQKFSSRTAAQHRSASLYVSEPYGLYGVETPGNALMGALPLTTGNSLRMHTPFFSAQTTGQTTLTLLLDDHDAARARTILRNCGGAEVRGR